NSCSSAFRLRLLSPASAPERNARRHSTITWGATWISRLISPRSSPRRRRSTISAFRFALQRSGSSRSPDDIEFSITTSPIFSTPPTYPSQVSREIGCSILGMFRGYVQTVNPHKHAARSPCGRHKLVPRGEPLHLAQTAGRQGRE